MVVVPEASPDPVVVVEELGPEPWTPGGVDVVVDPDDPRTVVVDVLDEPPGVVEVVTGRVV